MADPTVVVFVEIPGGSRNKYELDAESGQIMLDRRLFTSMSYPADYGFIEGTLGEDGDPLDALVLVSDPTFPGCRIRVRPIGVFHMSDGVVFVEIPSGSRNKYEWDDELGGIVLDRRLFTAMAYPADYGYVEGTLAEDGDPLDALVLVSDPTFPGCRIRVRTIGVFHMEDEKGPDEKLLAVPDGDPAFERIQDVDDVAAELRDEIEHFFQRYKDLEPQKKTETRGWGNREEAEQILGAARARA